MFRKLTIAAFLMLTAASQASAQYFQQQPVLVDPQLAQSIQVLENAKQVLFTANRNYAAHKNYAIQHITAAQNHLLLAMGQAPGAQTIMSVNPMAQGQRASDQKLLESINVLSNTIGYLQSTGLGGQHALAARDLQRAINELQRAIQYSRTNIPRR